MSTNDETQTEMPFIPIGEEREVIIKQRFNQHLFRNMVLSAYNNTCCITGLARPELIEACHYASKKVQTRFRFHRKAF